MHLKRLDYRRFDQSCLGLRAARHCHESAGAGLFHRPQAPLAQHRTRFAAAVGVRQAGAGHFSGILHRACVCAPSTTSTRSGRRCLRWACLRHGGRPDLGTAVVLVLTAAILFYVAGLDRKYIVATRRRWACCLLVVAIAWLSHIGSRALWRMFDPEFKIIDKVNPGGEIRAYVKRSLAAAIPAISRGSRGSPSGRAACSGVGTDAGQAEAAVPARSAHRLHLCRGRRRARACGARSAC